MATAILLAWWLFAPNLVFANSILTVDRKFRSLAIYAWGVALLNLVLSVSLTAAFGPSRASRSAPRERSWPRCRSISPAYVAKRRGLSLGSFVRPVWIPAIGLGAVLAAGLLAARFLFGIDSGPAVLALLVCGPLLYWAAFYLLALDRDERRLVPEIIGARKSPSRTPSAGAPG